MAKKDYSKEKKKCVKKRFVVYKNKPKKESISDEITDGISKLSRRIK